MVAFLHVAPVFQWSLIPAGSQNVAIRCFCQSLSLIHVINMLPEMIFDGCGILKSSLTKQKLQSNFSGSNTDGSFTTAVSKSLLSS